MVVDKLNRNEKDEIIELEFCFFNNIKIYFMYIKLTNISLQ